MLATQKIGYGLKKVALYSLIGLLSAAIPYLMIGIIFGALPILLGAICLSIADTLNLAKAPVSSGQALIVFTTAHQILIAILTVIVVMFYTFILVFS